MESSSKETVLALKDQRIAELEEQLSQAQTTIQTLIGQVQQLETEVKELKGKSKRQVTPFRRRKREEKAKKPGRKSGKGSFSHRAKPKPEQVTNTEEMPLEHCPECDGALTEGKG